MIREASEAEKPPRAIGRDLDAAVELGATMPTMPDVPADGVWRPEPFGSGTLMRRRRFCLVRYIRQGTEVQRQIACDTPDRPFLFGSASAAKKFVPELEWRERRMDKQPRTAEPSAETISDRDFEDRAIPAEPLSDVDFESRMHAAGERLLLAREQADKAMTALVEAGEELARVGTQLERRLQAARKALED